MRWYKVVTDVNVPTIENFSGRIQSSVSELQAPAFLHDALDDFDALVEEGSGPYGGIENLNEWGPWISCRRGSSIRLSVFATSPHVSVEAKPASSPNSARRSSCTLRTM